MLDTEKIRKDFPIFRRKINGRPFVFLDSASTSQKPRQVIDAIKDFYENNNSNVHRSVYKTSVEATGMYEDARQNLRRFLGAKGYHAIFTKNCTEAINLVAVGWARKNMKMGDRILSSVMEHHSNIVPWQNTGAPIDFLDVNDDGTLRLEEPKKKTRLVSVAHASNVLGTINDAKRITKDAHDNGSLVMLDGAQSAPHMEIDLDRIGCDFFALSGHKMLGPTGTGALLVRKDVAEEMDPLLFGSDMIKEVTLERTVLADSPMKFETGTPNIAGVVGLSAAIEYLEKIGMDKIEKHEKRIVADVGCDLESVRGLRLYGPAHSKTGVFSFNLGDAHSHDVATILDQRGIAVRSGHHCAQPLMRRFGTSSMVRASFYIYNDSEDASKLIEGLKEAGRVLKT